MEIIHLVHEIKIQKKGEVFMKKVILFVFLVLISFSYAHADSEKATVEDVYNLVLKAHEVLKTLGEDGLVAFNDPKGEFVYKDTYVYVLKCPDRMAAHPYVMNEAKGQDISKQPHAIQACASGKNSKGEWFEYRYPKPGEKEPSRKVCFSINVEGSPYTVLAGIFNDEYSVEKLNGSLK